ncbi:MAG: hypothetical protein NVS1B11_02480 [Terriglobales bacterium]
MTIRTNIVAHDFFESDAASKRGASALRTRATILAGTALTAVGIVRRGWTGTAMVIGGAYLTYRGVKDGAAPFHDEVRIGFTINKRPEEVYAFVRDSNNWALFLHGLTMEADGEQSFRITVGKPAGFEIESHVAITDEEAGRHIAWSSLSGPIQHRGVMHFKAAPRHRGTELTVAFEYAGPAGPIARAIASFVGWNPEHLVRQSLRHLKELLEAGELPTTSGQPVGPRGLKGAALRVLYREGATEDAKQQTRLAGD